MKRIARILLLIVGIVVIIFIALTVYMRYRPIVYVNKSLTFENKLAIPSILMPRIVNGEKVFDLTIHQKETQIFSDKMTKTLGYNGSILGPTLRVNTGDNVRFHITNDLDEETTVHWHGMELPASMDGGPHQTIPSGQIWEPHWTIKNEASTLWYHPHTLEKTGEQVYRGLAGLILVDDANSESLAIPQKYGEDDIPLIIQDKKFDANGQFIYDHTHTIPVTTGMLGDTILVNGTYAPYVDVPQKMIRLRLINGSNARRYNFGFSDHRIFTLIATDGGFLQEGIEQTRVQLSPGERAEILVTMADTIEPIQLLSYPVFGDTNSIRKFAVSRISGASDENQEMKVLELRPYTTKSSTSDIPQKLNKIEYLSEKGAVRTREFALNSSSINNEKMDMSRVDEIVRSGDIEIWKIRNESPLYHPFHIHGVQFQVLSRNGKKPLPIESGWKDTISLLPEETVRVILQFNQESDPNVPFMYHCHILEHEDMGMMGQFVVVDNDVQKEDIHINAPHNMTH
jgi:suppressor of ftsI